jgi:hypothetical protein
MSCGANATGAGAEEADHGPHRGRANRNAWPGMRSRRMRLSAPTSVISRARPLDAACCSSPRAFHQQRNNHDLRFAEERVGTHAMADLQRGILPNRTGACPAPIADETPFRLYFRPDLNTVISRSLLQIEHDDLLRQQRCLLTALLGMVPTAGARALSQFAAQAPAAGAVQASRQRGRRAKRSTIDGAERGLVAGCPPMTGFVQTEPGGAASERN